MATHIFATAICLLWTAIPAGPSGATTGMIEVVVDNRRIEGAPLAWNAKEVRLLGRDGRLWLFDPAQATSYRRTASRFEPYGVSELRAELLRELGSDYEATGTTHYLVAHPRGQRDRWAQRFEDLYRSAIRYFSVRGFKLTEPPFPLVGIVCRDRREFERYAAGQGVAVANGALGYYDLETNRIIVYDADRPGAGGQGWQQNASTVIHEATHQLAFNTGIHNRYCPPPVWVVEGLATLFEAPGVHDWQSHHSQSDRINRERLAGYRAMAGNRHDGRLPAELTAEDRLFRSSPAAAYAEAWAMTFCLMETQPRQFARYLAISASHRPFSDYKARERLGDFTTVFGGDWRLFDAQFGRFMDNLK
jgi:hypothetical protein